ncbi:hypothetical protein ACN28E_38920 [Archangium lansingense]|uniref:hypothetical protein n=1 Tax=Archangium lansingense TaxID=2995310 RepID=UPI003B78ED1E
MFVRQLHPDQSREPYECNSSDEQAAIGDLRLAINAEVAPAIIELPLPRLNELLQGIIEGLRVAVSKRQERIPVRVDSTFQYDLPASQGRVEHSPLV